MCNVIVCSVQSKEEKLIPRNGALLAILSVAVESTVIPLTCSSNKHCSSLEWITPFHVVIILSLWTNINAGNACGITPFNTNSTFKSLLLFLTSSTLNLPITNESFHSFANCSSRGSINLHGPHLYYIILSLNRGRRTS